MLYFTAVAQCTFYTLFQALENIGLLTDSKVLSPALAARIDRTGTVGSTASVYKYSYRAWLCGVLCDFVRLAREAQLERARRAERVGGQKSGMELVREREQNEAVDAKWWREMVVPLSWTPVAVHFATESGVPGFNLGWMGALGGMAGLGKFADVWASTK